MLKDKLCNKPVVKILNYEHQMEFHVDGSQDDFGGVYSKNIYVEDGQLHPAPQFIIGVRKPTTPKENTLTTNWNEGVYELDDPGAEVTFICRISLVMLQDSGLFESNPPNPKLTGSSTITISK
ncbi:hypothetical protein QE152_g32213 [Popillia japonica]|uniref:Uncharacterized protein n=1 Tax=Popillia japonica TaxID=7064 RepID=A0AAW1IZR4_POPJA